MAISTETRRSDRYACDGVQTVFSFAFKVFEADEVGVIVSADGETETTLSPELYNVSLNGDQDNSPGGSVTLLTAPTAGSVLVVVSDVDYTQPIVFTNQGGFYPELLNEGYDRAIILTQQLKEQLDRTLVVPVTSEKTPQQTMQEILDIAATANEYSGQALASAEAAAESAESAAESAAVVAQAVPYLQDIETVADNSEDVSAVAAIKDEIVTDAGIAEEIVAVADMATTVASVGENIDHVVDVSENMADVRAIAGDISIVCTPDGENYGDISEDQDTTC